MTFHKGRKSKKEYRRQWLTEHQLVLRNIDTYKHLLSRGYKKEQVIKLLRKGASMDSLSKLQHRVGVAQHTVGVTGVSLEGIRITDMVKKYIKELTNDNIILSYHKGQVSLRLTKPKVWET